MQTDKIFPAIFFIFKFNWINQREGHQVKAFHQTLQELLKQTTKNVQQAGQRLGTDVYSGSDEMDRSVAESDRRLLILMAERDRNQIKEIDRALKRIESGEYGTCNACGNKISMRRLKVNPTATLCTHCQQTMETREKFGICQGH